MEARINCSSIRKRGAPQGSRVARAVEWRWLGLPPDGDRTSSRPSIRLSRRLVPDGRRRAQTARGCDIHGKGSAQYADPLDPSGRADARRPAGNLRSRCGTDWPGSVPPSRGDCRPLRNALWRHGICRHKQVECAVTPGASSAYSLSRKEEGYESQVVCGCGCRNPSLPPAPRTRPRCPLLR